MHDIRKKQKIPIVHIITGLSVGGAEMMLYKLLAHMDRNRFEPYVISLTQTDMIGHDIKALNIPVYGLNLSANRFNPLKLIQCVKIVKKIEPVIVQTWLYHADLLGSVISKIATRAKIVWNIRHSDFDPSRDKTTTILIAKINAFLSKWIPDSIICNSSRAVLIHNNIGYDSKKMHVIGNGFDLDQFRPDCDAYRALRSELNLSSETLIVGMVGRFHSQKNHYGFVKAIAKVLKIMPNIHFVLCGNEVDENNQILTSWIEDYDLTPNIHPMGQRFDMNRITSAFDVAVSASSVGEGFSNVIGEAMACAVPCVVTDVGDSAYLVKDTGIVVSPGSMQELSQAIVALLKLKRDDRKKMGLKARMRIDTHFSIDKIVLQYEKAYLSLINRSSNGQLKKNTHTC